MPLEYEIDPHNRITDDTICATLRTIWREADRLNSQDIKSLTAIAFDKAKRMDRKLRMYRKRFLQLPHDVQDKLSTITGEE